MYLIEFQRSRAAAWESYAQFAGAPGATTAEIRRRAQASAHHLLASLREGNHPRAAVRLRLASTGREVELPADPVPLERHINTSGGLFDEV